MCEREKERECDQACSIICAGFISVLLLTEVERRRELKIEQTRVANTAKTNNIFF